MKYALLVYDSSASWDDLPPDDKRALHDPAEYRATSTGSVNLLAHYRLHSPRLTTTVRMAGDEVIRSDGPAAAASEALRALFLLESDDREAALDIACRLPAVRMGGSVEVWPLIEPDLHGRRRRGHRGWARHRAA